jgi:hypothetical protein
MIEKHKRTSQREKLQTGRYGIIFHQNVCRTRIQKVPIFAASKILSGISR